MFVELSETLVLVLVHSLWQGILIACLVSIALRWLPARRAESRYVTSIAGLGLIVLSALVTWSVLTLEPPQRAVQSTANARATTNAADVIKPVSPANLEGTSRPVSQASFGGGSVRTTIPSAVSLRPWMPWAAAVWFFGACVMLIRSVAAIVQVRRWRTSTALVANESLDGLKALKQELCERLHLQRLVSMIISDRVNVPSVIGTLWPCILIPPAMLTGIPLDQWRVILAHELAHIRRYDVLVNLIQMLIESLLFFNPAVWWLNRQIRAEREACCDAMAVEVCGQPLSVARTLVEFAASLRQDACWPSATNDRDRAPHPSAHSSSVMAFADQADPGELTDRVQRIVQPNVASRPRISWFGLCLVICSLIVAGLALQWGTKLAVRTAVNMMSPRERIAKLERLQESTTGVYLPPEPGDTKNSAGDKPDVTKVNATTPDLIEVTLVIRTEDGSPIPRGLHVTNVSQTHNSLNSGALDTNNEDVAEYRNTQSYVPCKLRFGANVAGYAPTVSPILDLTTRDLKRTVELVLSKGSTVTVNLRDPQDRPIAGAVGKLSTFIAISTGSSSTGLQELTSNDAGTIQIEHAGPQPCKLELRAPGFQRQGMKFEFKPNETIRIELQPATPTALQVVDAETGAPIADARFMIGSTQSSQGNVSFNDPRRQSTTDPWLNYGVSNTEGHVVLNELQEGTRYTFGVVAAGYAMTVLENVFAGQSPAVVKMSRPLTLAGHIEGSLDQLGVVSKNGTGQPQRVLGGSRRINNLIQDSFSFPVDASGKFEINDLVQGERVSLYVAGRNEEFVMSKSRTDVTLKINDPTAEKSPPTQDIVIRVTGTIPTAPARGTLYVSTQHNDLHYRYLPSGSHPLQGNEVHLKAPIGSTLYVRPDNLVGYRIPESGPVVVTAGLGTQLVELPAKPAGGIFGTIVRADGSPADSGYITVFATELPPDEKDRSRLNPSVSSASSSFLVSLPLGGKYRVLAREFTAEHNVWTLSDEVILTEANPIAELPLKLPEGRPVSIKVVDPDGKPVVGRDVRPSVSFSIPKGNHSFGASFNRLTNLAGEATFESVSRVTPGGPLEVQFHAEIAPSQFRGLQEKVDTNKPIEIRLDRGVSATGIVVDSASGKRIPHAEINVMPKDFMRAKFHGPISTVTDDQGQFKLEGLEPIEYQGSVEGSVPKGAIVTPHVGGGHRITYPAGVEHHRLRGGDTNPVHWEVTVYPGSRLKVPE